MCTFELALALAKREEQRKRLAVQARRDGAC